MEKYSNENFNYAEQKEGNETNRRSNIAKAGLLIVGSIGIGCGIVGFKAGLNLGRNQGFRAGIAYSQEKFYDTMKYLAEAVKKDEGE